jgi:hypothetical protein
MMFLLASILMGLERLVLLFLKPFYVLAGYEPARDAIQLIALNSPLVSRTRIFLHHEPQVSAPAHVRR